VLLAGLLVGLLLPAVAAAALLLPAAAAAALPRAAVVRWFLWPVQRWGQPSTRAQAVRSKVAHASGGP